MFTKDDLIYAYTRSQALADGVLVDVSAMATEAGFRVPVAFTHAVYGKYVQVPEQVDGQDEAGRLWDILTVLRYAIKAAGPSRESLLFTVAVNNDGHRAKDVALKAVCGPDYGMEPCLTIMLPEED